MSVRIVVADSSPIRCLSSDRPSRNILGPSLLNTSSLSRQSVLEELTQDETPKAVREWIETLPAWLEIWPQPPGPPGESWRDLDEGERAVIDLGAEIKADLLLMDDRAGVRAARGRGFRVIGTLRVLDLAARRGFVNWDDAIGRLSKTNFRYRPDPGGIGSRAKIGRRPILRVARA